MAWKIKIVSLKSIIKMLTFTFKSLNILRQTKTRFIKLEMLIFLKVKIKRNAASILNQEIQNIVIEF